MQGCDAKSEGLGRWEAFKVKHLGDLGAGFAKHEHLGIGERSYIYNIYLIISIYIIYIYILLYIHETLHKESLTAGVETIKLDNCK